jgi:hypothetical protein
MISDKCRFSTVFVIALKIKFFFFMWNIPADVPLKSVSKFSATHTTFFLIVYNVATSSLPRVYVIIRRSYENMQAYQCIISRECFQWEPNSSMQTNRQTDTTNLIVVFLNFAKASRKRPLNPVIVTHKIYYLKGLMPYEISTWNCAPTEGLYQLMVFTVFLSHSMKYYIT